MMRARIGIFIFVTALLAGIPASAQQRDSHHQAIRRILDSLAAMDARFLEPVDVSVTNFPVADLLKTLAVGNNLNVSLDLDRFKGSITCHLERVPVKDILLLCCRESSLDLVADPAGIVTIRAWQEPEPPRLLSVARDSTGLYDMDFSDCQLDVLVRKLISETGVNMLYAPSLSGKTVSGMGVGMTLEQMMESIAAANGLRCELSASGIWMIGEKGGGTGSFFPERLPDETVLPFCVRVFPMQYRTIDDVVEIIPSHLKTDVEIKLFSDQNSLVLSGSEPDVQRLDDYLRSIDRSVPLISIDVMIVDATDRKSRSTGVSIGKGREASGTSSGTLSPGVDVSIGAGTINRLLGSFNGLGLVNLGQVGPEFYAGLKLLEEDGMLTLRSTPKLSTLNGHKAVLKSGEVKYYKESQVNIIGTQNPLQSESYLWKNVEAGFTLDMTPVVSADSTITIRIGLSQDEFTERDSGDMTAPPGMTKRSFNSIVKVKDGEMILLGGIEKNLLEDRSSGLPWIARVPVLRLFFGNVTRTREVQKLNVFIRPTIVL